MRLFLSTILPLFLFLLSFANANAVPGAPKRSNYSKTLTVTKILQLLKCHRASASLFCSTYLHYNDRTTRTITKTTRKTRNIGTTTTITKTITKSVVDCTVTEPYFYDTTTLFVGPASTLTELQVVSTSISLIFGGPIISAEDKKKVKRNLKYPKPTLSHAHPSSLSKACSSLIGRPPPRKTTTITVNKYISKVTTYTRYKTQALTVSSCTDTQFTLLLATETAPSTTILSEGFKTVTVATTTETIEYFCWPLGFGCAAVPTPCCPGACERVSGRGNICVPTDAAEKEVFISSLLAGN
ncbi:hypothetical protein TWF106_003574 [Orbilia oligospora]|uniref:Uncharacterized protein n=1 Tax=Orbilia oligospora TaxID=2813651 RepID=A0A6G1MLV2_ORBOL|nr:hypothetical protein TWF788_010333 [Orbilia oligospora]KAF3211949.1 hypothetical protein TWF191_010607 [Orbilia oligospora]KAF3212291.1 hypothetical protein TWF679_006063 [Orbilia oligospora]KAF3224605.1 hypothetical protein TWF106_003574 [Orbilia oligospora]KAF3261045.1 hypothetical protein TWF192_008978 [Orbilia oligospora]